jgi:hypothetical protein
MSSPFPPTPPTFDSNLPIQLMAPPAMPSLSDCFPFGSVDLGKYVVYSTALRQRVCWHNSLVMTLDGLGASSSLMDDMADVPREQKTRTKHFILSRRDSVGAQSSAGDYQTACCDLMHGQMCRCQRKKEDGEGGHPTWLLSIIDERRTHNLSLSTCCRI